MPTTTRTRFLGTNLTIVQGEPDLPDFDIDLIADNPDADLLNDPCNGKEF